MNIQEIIQILTNSGIAPNEAAIEIRMLIEHFCGYSATDIIMGKPLDYEKLKIVKQKAERRARTKEPIQYIIGQAYFMGNYYQVNPNVLIPRDETELVVRHAINIINTQKLKTILDIGTGTGCIACSISEKCDCEVTAADISEKALETAKTNAKNLYQDINFIKSDVFSNLNDNKYDLIISNPPYIPKGTKVQTEVKFEPELALFTSEETGCEFYRRIIEEGVHHLNKNGYIVFELGKDEAATVSDMFKLNGYTEIKLEKDLAEIDRVISARIG